MVDEKLNQIHSVLRQMLLYFEEHQFEDGATSKLFAEMAELDEMMKSVVITEEMVRDIREYTGDGLMACHKALERANGDMKKAKEYLR